MKSNSKIKSKILSSSAGKILSTEGKGILRENRQVCP